MFTPDELITPDDVRGTDPSLGHAVRTHGWPTLGAVRGRIMFMLDNENFAPIELAGPSVAARPDPVRVVGARRRRRRGREAQRPDRRRGQDQGRARRQHARAHPRRRRHRAGPANDTTMREAALTGGAQFVSTDYEVPDPRFGPYVVRIPGGTPARCNPVTAPPTATRPTSRTRSALDRRPVTDTAGSSRRTSRRSGPVTPTRSVPCSAPTPSSSSAPARSVGPTPSPASTATSRSWSTTCGRTRARSRSTATGSRSRSGSV